MSRLAFVLFSWGLLASAVGAQDLILTGVVDGPLSGGTPKAVEVYVAADVPDLTRYGLGSANNGGGSDGQEFTFSGSATEGDFLYVASEAPNFTTFFGFAPTATSSAVGVNGDDAVELFFDGAVIDTFGEIDVDGSGEPWDYTDGWAYRRDATGPDGAAFPIPNWAFSGTEVLLGYRTNSDDDLLRPFPVGTYSPLLAASGFITPGMTPGWRQLSSPVAGLTVSGLAAQNLVSGVAGYDGAGCTYVNLYTEYTGDRDAASGGYTAPSGPADELVSGAGFFWYFFGDTPPPVQSATCGPSTSASLPATVSATRAGPVGDVVWTTERVEDPDNGGDGGDGFYLGGNPYGEGFDLESAGGYDGSVYGVDYGSKLVTFTSVKQVWNPEGPGYDMIVTLDDGGDDGSGGSAVSDNIAPWQGIWLEAIFAPQPAGEIVYRRRFSTGTAVRPFVGRVSAETALAEGATFGFSQIRLTLRGMLATGEPVYDGAIGVLMGEGGRDGWGRLDASKLDPPSASFAQLALIGAGRDGTDVRKAVEGRGLSSGSFRVPARLETSAAGSFDLTWPAAAMPGAAWLHDLQTGQAYRLDLPGSLSFTTDGPTADDRFEIRVDPLLVDAEPAPTGIEISAVAPNPAVRHAGLSVRVGRAGPVTVRIYDALGRLVAMPHDAPASAGETVRVLMDVGSLAPGAYVVHIAGDAFQETRRLTVVR